MEGQQYKFHGMPDEIEETMLIPSKEIKLSDLHRRMTHSP